MAFWKKGEDPWDRKPEKRSAPAFKGPDAARPGKPDLLDQLKAWNESRREEQARKAAAETPAPIPCPWCGKMMEPGQLTGGRGVFWSPGVPTAVEKWVAPGREYIRVDTEGVFYVYQTAWFCRDCRRLAAELPEPESRPQGQMDCENELRRYAEQANKREGET